MLPERSRSRPRLRAPGWGRSARGSGWRAPAARLPVELAPLRARVGSLVRIEASPDEIVGDGIAMHLHRVAEGVAGEVENAELLRVVRLLDLLDEMRLHPVRRAHVDLHRDPA